MCLLSISYVLLSNQAFAGLPLSIKEITAKHKEVKIELGTTFISNEQNNVAVNYAFPAMLPNAYIVNLPLDVNYTKKTTDGIIGSLVFKYGFFDKTKVSTHISGLSFRDSYIGLNNLKSFSTAFKLNDLNIGLQYKLIENGKNSALNAALIVFFDLGLIDSIKNKSVIKNYTIGLSTYTVIDPIVISSTASYRRNQSKEIPDLFTLSPSVAFAVNDSIQLNGGITVQITQKNKYTPHSMNTLYLNLGVGQALNKKTNLDFTLNHSLSGNKNSNLGIGIMCKF